MSVISRRIARELSDPEFRNSYKRARVRSKIVYQIRALRKQREWLQGKLAEVMKKPQSTVSRFEDSDYGKLTLETLFEISDAFDIGIIVEFVSYPEFMVRTSNLSTDTLMAPSFNSKSLELLSCEPAVYIHQAELYKPATIETIKVSDAGMSVPPFGIKSTSYQTEILAGGINV